MPTIIAEDSRYNPLYDAVAPFLRGGLFLYFFCEDLQQTVVRKRDRPSLYRMLL
ncbi:hypothetical protein HM1_1905 [Heliomicrobium modesticaldum Ice1]|uniref:Uncharacterized protein n=1 Tax=Heliobacterium modesticaldum (strain ATCC 51547 / Ice1) TaxID=498761 RepID=B0TFN3_HELMI|nr:hypothetical protein HM1_1905 [Heliomicrobium modesticaldum Ice1]